MKKKTVAAVLLIAAALMLSSCSIIQGLLGGSMSDFVNLYPARTVALEALAQGSADFEDLPFDDQWGLIWTGLFRSMTTSPKTSDPYLPALKKIGYYPVNYDDYYNESYGYTTYYYRIEDKEDLQELAAIELTLLSYMPDPEIQVQLLEDFFSKILSDQGKYNGYALQPFLSLLNDYARELFEYDKAVKNPAELAADSFGARCAKAYVEKYPAGNFIEFAKARVQAAAGTEAELII